MCSFIINVQFFEHVEIVSNNMSNICPMSAVVEGVKQPEDPEIFVQRRNCSFQYDGYLSPD